MFCKKKNVKHLKIWFKINNTKKSVYNKTKIILTQLKK